MRRRSEEGAGFVFPEVVTIFLAALCFLAPLSELWAQEEEDRWGSGGSWEKSERARDEGNDGLSALVSRGGHEDARSSLQHARRRSMAHRELVIARAVLSNCVRTLGSASISGMKAKTVVSDEVSSGVASSRHGRLLQGANAKTVNYSS